MPRDSRGDARDLQDLLHDYFATARSGDAERMAQRLALRHSADANIVGLRRNGREVVLHEERSTEPTGSLTIHSVGRAGELTRTAVIQRGADLKQWLEEHYHYLDWVNPAYQP